MTRARRPNLYVINALSRRYGRCKGALAAPDLFTDRERIRADMGHLAAVLAMFEPGVDPRHPAVQARARTLEPLGAGYPAQVMSIGYSLQTVIARLAAKGLVTITGKPRRWSIAGEC